MDDNFLVNHPLFKERAFSDACRSVIGVCNDISFEDRWEKETPLFGTAILRNLPEGDITVLDYGTGVGRIAKELIQRHPTLKLLGLDESVVNLAHAAKYVNDPRFTPIRPHELKQQVDLVYCIYVLQHIPAILLRSAIERIHYWLKPGGTFLFCSAYSRMTPRFDGDLTFFDDRLLGVNLKAEVERLFEPVGDLFSEEDLNSNIVVKRMIKGIDNRRVPAADGRWGVAHPATIYRRRELQVPYFDAPWPGWYIQGD